MLPTDVDAVQPGCYKAPDGLPPVFADLTIKLSSTLIAMKSLSLSPQEIATYRRILTQELKEMKQEMALAKECLNSFKDDLIKVKVLTKELENCHDNIETLNPLLPVDVEEESLPSLPLASEVSRKSDISTIAHLQRRDWDSVPGYLKLRLKLEQVNEFIDIFNKELIQKYTILKKKRPALSRSENAVWASYKALETEQTKGQYFLVASDLKAAGKSERTFSTMSGILRHCRRLREMRTGKIVRYVVAKP